MILCEVRECLYHIRKPDEGAAYQHQCSNDEIEIGIGEAGVPECFSFEREKID